jgi:hypothetical protein
VLGLSSVSTTTHCSVPSGALALGVRAGTGDTTLVSLAIERR